MVTDSMCRVENALPSAASVVVFVAGGLLGSIITQVFLPGADWQSCQQIGITSAARASHYGHTQMSRPGIFSSTEFYQTRVNGTYNATSPFRGPPTVEVDAAWESYWKVWMFSVGEETFRESHPQYPESSVRLGNNLTYLATFEATHQLHCLYSLFRASYLDAYPDERASYEHDPRSWHERVDHCVEILRQKLECDGDTTIITYNWVEGKTAPTANFNVQRTCPDIRGVMDHWAAQHQVTQLPTKPSDAVQLPRIP